MNPREDWLVERVKEQKILDIGFIGKGREGVKLHRRFRKKATELLVGLDINVDQALVLKEPNSLVGDTQKLPFKDGSFDAVVLGEVIEHFFMIDRLIVEVSRVLEKSGRLYVTTPNAYAFFRWFKCWLLVKDRGISAKNNVRNFLGDDDHKILWEPLSLINLLDKFNLRTVLVTTKGLGFPYIDFLRETNIPFWPFNRLGEYICLVAVKK